MSKRSKNKRKRAKAKTRYNPPKTIDIIRRQFHPEAPSAAFHRSVMKELMGEAEFAEIGHDVLGMIRLVGKDSEGAVLKGDGEGVEAYEALMEIHDSLVFHADVIAQSMGTAEWLYWLRRLRGQFAGENSLRSTEPYIQGLAEALAMQSHRPSIPLVADHRHAYDLSTESLVQLLMLHHIAGFTYDLHSTIKRCAKGQKVRFIPGQIPRWIDNADLDRRLRTFDRRTQMADVGALAALGIRESPKSIDFPGPPIGGHVPLWRRPLLLSNNFRTDDPVPYVLGTVNLDSLGTLANTLELTKVQVSLVLLLWACQFAMTESEEAFRIRATPALQWGYFLLRTDETFIPALEVTIAQLDDNCGRALNNSWRPGSAREVFEVLRSMRSEIYAPLTGCPIHESGEFTAIDVLGATSTLLDTMRRPIGHKVNAWSSRFEDDVQDAIDASRWRPSAEVRNLKGRKLTRRDGTALTDIDAVAYRGKRLLLVSCKSTAVTQEIVRGAFAETRNARDRAHEALEEWGSKIAEVRRDPAILGIALPKNIQIDGCVVFPSVPFYTDPRGDRLVFGLLPTLSSLAEFEGALSKS